MKKTRPSLPSPGGHPHSGTGCRRPIPSLYCLKALCAFFVVCIHFPVLGREYLFPLLRVAVPIFFIISGFFLYASARADAQAHLRKSLGKVFLLTLLANAVYGTVRFIACLQHPGTDFAIHDLQSALEFLFIGDTFSGHLWYLTAYLETLLVFGLFHFYEKEHWLFCAIPPCLLLNLYFGYNIGVYHSLVLARNFVTVGLPCFCLGWLLRKYETPICRSIGGGKASLLLLALLLLSYLEWVLPRFTGYDLWSGGDIYLFTVPLSLGAIVWCLTHRDMGQASYFAVIGKKHATNVYLYHVLVGIYFIGYLGRLSGIRFPEEVLAVLVFGMTLLAVAGLDRLFGRKPAVSQTDSAKVR